MKPFVRGVRSRLALLLLVVLSSLATGCDGLFEREEDGSLTVTFIDVGCADSALVTWRGADGTEQMLVDAGNVNDSQKIFTILQREVGDRGLDYAVMTHLHEDHGGGMASALTAVDAREVWCPNNEGTARFFTKFLEKAAERGRTPYCPALGSTHALGGATVRVLGPEDPSADVKNKNNTSIVLMVSYAGRRILFSADAEREEEAFLVERWGAEGLKADVYKMGHHGSRTSSTYPYLRCVLPQYTVCSTDEKGEGAKYGLPDEDALSRIRDVGSTLYRTDIQGDITLSIASDGTMSWTFERNGEVEANPTVGE